jgi:hypothetical protein
VGHDETKFRGADGSTKWVMTRQFRGADRSSKGEWRGADGSSKGIMTRLSSVALAGAPSGS